MAARFGSFSTDDIEEIEQKTDKENTKKVIKKSVNALRAFLFEKNLNTDFESLSKTDLDQTLKSFYANARTEKGEFYKLSSFNQLKYGLTKHLKSKDIDITGDDFKKSTETFKAMKKDLMRRGKGSVNHRNPISKGDLQKLYDHPRVFNIDTPTGLLQKVIFELMLYTCRRGRENLHDMTKSTYGVFKDDAGREYIQQVQSEADKNHDENMSSDGTTGEGRMYDHPGSMRCPVLSFKRYISKLHPDLDALWQRPVNSYLASDQTWYCKMVLGVNPLSSMMSTISKRADLSTIYTNHSIRTTSVTIMDEAGFEARHIMRVSGHR